MTAMKITQSRGKIGWVLKPVLVLYLFPLCLFGQSQVRAVLPPELQWKGKSETLVVADNDPWITPAEKSKFEHTPRYDETIAWLQKLVDEAPQLNMVSLGRSPEGRDIWMVIASKEQASSPEALQESGKPILLAQAGIHSGEIDGKDAGLMLLRDMTVRGTKADLLDRANLLFVPIFSVDAHERFSPYNRINQRGPQEMGWRTNARNLNLNRDYAKLDTPEMRAMIAALNRWQPDLYFDLHVTDGADYQYDITFGYTGTHGYSPNGARWMDEYLKPALYHDLRLMGHIPGPLIFPASNRNLSRGLVEWTATPRFSNGYGDARHLPTVLVENHSLKPYKQRVLGTYVLLESVLRVLGRDGLKLREATKADRRRRPAEVVLAWKPAREQTERMEYLGVVSRLDSSEITGRKYVQWTGKPVQMNVPVIKFSEPAAKIAMPKAYWIPPAWFEVIERLALHGIRMQRIERAKEVEVEMYRVTEAKLAEQPFEGHVQVTCTPVVEKRRHRFAAGSVRVSTDQPLGELAALLLEPGSPDSFFQWGFFLEILSRTEYAEAYVLEPLAARMLQEDAQIRQEYEQKMKSDSTFAANPRARLQWFYRKSPYFDQQWLLYPVGREVE